MLTRKIKLCHINAHITCRLCEGYLIDATTVTECLHTCKSFLTRQLSFLCLGSSLLVFLSLVSLFCLTLWLCVSEGFSWLKRCCLQDLSLIGRLLQAERFLCDPCSSDSSYILTFITACSLCDHLLTSVSQHTTFPSFLFMQSTISAIKQTTFLI